MEMAVSTSPRSLNPVGLVMTACADSFNRVGHGGPDADDGVGRVCAQSQHQTDYGKRRASLKVVSLPRSSLRRCHYEAVGNKPSTGKVRVVARKKRGRCRL